MVGPTRTWTQLAVTAQEEAADAAAFVVDAATRDGERERGGEAKENGIKNAWAVEAGSGHRRTNKLDANANKRKL